MIIFDINKLHVRYVLLKSATTALGGSIRYVDELATAANPQGKEIYRKMDVPMALIRLFVIKHKTSQYVKPVPTAVVTYENHVVAIERHPLGSIGTLTESENEAGLFEEGPARWRSSCERNIQNTLRTLINKYEQFDRTWYIDGKFIYSFEGSEHNCVRLGDRLSSDGKFRAVDVDAIKLADLSEGSKLCVATRQCLAFCPDRTEDFTYALSPPVWKQLEVANKQLSSVNNDTSAKEKKFRFDQIDERLAVNLNFVLKAGNELGQIFGPEIMEPLNMPKLMVQLNTVNLPSVANSVKSTFDTGISFTHACAWLIGLVSRTQTLESYMVLRSILKYLTQKGIFRKNMFDPNHVFKSGFTIDSVPLKTKETALTTAEAPTIEEWVRRQRSRGDSTIVASTDMGAMIENDQEFG